MGLVFWVPGVVLALVGWVWLLVLAFRQHVLWGLAGLCVQPVLLIFVVVHWDKASRPAGIWFLGWVMTLIGESITPRLSDRWRRHRAGEHRSL